MDNVQKIVRGRRGIDPSSPKNQLLARMVEDHVEVDAMIERLGLSRHAFWKRVSRLGLTTKYK